MAQNKEIYEERLKQMQTQKKINRDTEAMIVMLNREISEKKNENKRM